MIRSVCTVFINSAVFRKRSPNAKILWYALYFHQSQHLCGIFACDIDHMVFETGLSNESVVGALAELERHGLVQLDRELDLVWLPEMTARALAMVKAGGTVATSAAKHIASLGKSALCHRVCDTLGIPYRYSTDTPLSVSGSGTVLDSEPDTEKKSLSRVASDVPRNGVEALAALVDGLGAKSACEALQAPKHASTTGLPMNAENGWLGVWRALCEAIDKPTTDDLRKLGRWWARGGAAKCKKPRFTYLSNVDRITEWLATSRAWDGVSDPTPSEEPRAGPGRWKADPTAGSNEKDYAKETREWMNRQG